MNQLKRLLKADCIKLKKTPFFSLHGIIPLVGIGIFAAYQAMSNYSSNQLMINYFQVLALIYPLLIAWLTTIVTDQEIEAGGAYFLLNSSSKFYMLTAKILLLVLSGLFSCLFVGIGYHLFAHFREDYSLSFFLVLLLVAVIWCSSVTISLQFSFMARFLFRPQCKFCDCSSRTSAFCIAINGARRNDLVLFSLRMGNSASSFGCEFCQGEHTRHFNENRTWNR